MKQRQSAPYGTGCFFVSVRLFFGIYAENKAIGLLFRGFTIICELKVRFRKMPSSEKYGCFVVKLGR